VRIVADTKLIVSAFLWGGTPRRVLDAVETGEVELFGSRALITELEDVLSRVYRRIAGRGRANRR